jgi:Xaa-Pro aminopeptidase
MLKVVSSLTEIAYLLNLRGGDYRYIPVFRAFLIVSHYEILLYTNRARISIEAQIMLNFDLKTNSCFKEKCVVIKSYEDFWRDLQHFSYGWKNVLLPIGSSLDMGASEGIYSSLLSNEKIKISQHISPIVFMRAQKNEVKLLSVVGLQFHKKKLFFLGRKNGHAISARSRCSSGL